MPLDKGRKRKENVQASDKISDKHLGILGINGSGKTYAAKGLAERLLDTKQRICVLDPTGVWFGLKSSTTGKNAGYPVVIFGGPHADVQISGLHGEAIAEAIGTSTTPAIIDVSQMKGSERTKFFADFAETLRIKNTGPLNLFIDEAHLFMPQGRVADPQSANMLHAANNLISLGRSRGLRITIISQRPAKIHKDSLTQVHSLIAMRLIAPQDRAAVEAWIADQADVQQGKEIIASLPSLKTGEGWLWAPEIDVLERIKFPKITTFDSSRSPDGESGAKLVLAPINLDAIQGKLASIKNEKVANDPAALKRQVAELQRQLVAKPPAQPTADKAAIQRAYADGFKAGQESYGMAFQSMQGHMAKSVFDLINSYKAPRPGKMPKFSAATPVVTTPKTAATIEQTKSAIGSADDLNGPQKRIVNSLRFWRSVGYDNPSREQVAAVAGYSAQGGAFGVPASQLCTMGIVGKPGNGNLTLLKDVGGDAIDPKANILSILDGPQKRILDSFLAHDPYQVLDRAEVAKRANYEAQGGAFGVPTSKLCTLRILEKPANGQLKMSDWALEVLA